MLKWFKVLLFTILLALSTYFLATSFWQVTSSPDFIFSFNLSQLTPVIWLIVSIYCVATSFALLATLAPNIYVKLISYILASATIYLVLGNTELSIFGSLILIAIFLFGNFEIRNQINSYFHFNPRIIYSSSLHIFVTMLTVLVATGFFFLYRDYINQNGFTIPKELINQVTDLAVKNLANKFSDQRDSLNIDPEKLSKFGLKDFNPADLGLAKEGLAKNINEELNKELTKNIENLINPYIEYLPLILAVLFFLSIHSLSGLGFFLVPLALSVIFFFLEKTKLVLFEEQTEVVKRLVLESTKGRIISENKVADSELKEQVKPS